MTIRETIDAINEEMLNREVSPQRARELLVQLTGLTGTCMEQSRIADAEFNKHLLACLDSDDVAAKAKIRAEVSAEALARREAHDYFKLVSKMCSNLNAMLRSLSEEMRLAR